MGGIESYAELRLIKLFNTYHRLHTTFRLIKLSNTSDDQLSNTSLLIVEQISDPFDVIYQ
jgi:hypothetical protein